MVAAAQDAQPQLTQEQQEWQTKLIPWRSQPALSGLELGSYNTAADGSQTVDIQSRFAGYSVAVFDASDALWQALNS